MDYMAMNQRIVIETQKTCADELGNHTMTWIPFHACYAKVTDEERGQESESESAGQTLAYPKARMTIRWCKKLDSLDSLSYRVHFRGHIWNILSCNHHAYQRDCLILLCQRESG